MVSSPLGMRNIESESTSMEGYESRNKKLKKKSNNKKRKGEKKEITKSG